MQPTRMDDFPHVFIQLPEYSCKMHTKQEGVMGGHAMTNKVSWVGIPWQKQGSVTGGHAMTNKKVSRVDMPWQNKEVSWVGVP